jgi:hypothetical protein
MMLGYVLAAWKEISAARRQRVRELAAKCLGRYRNRLTAMCFLPWAALVARSRQEQGRRLRWLTVYTYGDDLGRLAKAVLDAMAEHAVERRRTREAIVRTALGKLRLGLVQQMFADWKAFTKASTSERAAADAEEYERRRVDVQSEVLSLRRQLALTRKELAHVSASTAWRYELAVVRNELRHAIKVIAMHADGVFGGVSGSRGDGGATAAERAEWMASGGGADAAFADAAGLPGVTVRADAWSTPREGGERPVSPTGGRADDDGAPLLSPLADADVDATLRLPDHHYYTTPAKLGGGAGGAPGGGAGGGGVRDHRTYPLRPGAHVAAQPGGSRPGSAGGAHHHRQPTLGVTGVVRAEPPAKGFMTPRPPSAPAGGATLASRMQAQSPRVRGLATAHEIHAHVAQRLGREQDRLGLERTQSDQPPWVPRMA